MKNLITSLILLGIEIILIIILWNKLPETIPIHFNFEGQADNYADKIAIIYIPIITLILNIFLLLVPTIFKQKESFERSRKYYDFAITIFNTILFIVFIMLLYTATTNKTENVINIVPIIIGITFILLGNITPKIKHNNIVGIRTPWTLKNEVSWRKTHRIGGKIFVAAGFIWIISSLLASPYNIIVPTIIMLLSILYLTRYSYIVYKNQK